MTACVYVCIDKYLWMFTYVGFFVPFGVGVFVSISLLRYRFTMGASLISQLALLVARHFVAELCSYIIIFMANKTWYGMD